MLSETADIDSDSITVQDNVSDWRVDDVIVIATTGGFTSQGETEVFSIVGVDESGTVITLNDTLEYKHMGISETHGTRPVSRCNSRHFSDYGFQTF